MHQKVNRTTVHLGLLKTVPRICKTTCFVYVQYYSGLSPSRFAYKVRDTGFPQSMNLV